MSKQFPRTARRGPILVMDPDAVSSRTRARLRRKKKSAKRQVVLPSGSRLLNDPGTLQPPVRRSRRVMNAGPGLLANGPDLRRSDIITVPFDCTSVPLYWNATLGSTVFGSATSTLVGLNLDPSGGYGNYYPFGVPLNNLQSSYRRWRIASLRIKFRTALASSAIAPICLACIADGGYSTAAIPILANLMSAAGSRTFNATEDMDIPAHYVPDWLFGQDSSATTTSSRRETDAGIVLGGAFSSTGLSAGQLLGFIELSGVIQFADLSTGFTSVDARRPGAAQCSPPSLLPSSQPDPSEAAATDRLPAGPPTRDSSYFFLRRQ